MYDRVTLTDRPWEDMAAEVCSIDITYFSETRHLYRLALEELLTGNAAQDFLWVDPNQLRFFRETFGSSAFICRYTHCSRATEGFDSAKRRDDHEAAHQRKYRCGHISCLSYLTGFSTRSALNQHNDRYHPTAVQDMSLSKGIALVLRPAQMQGLVAGTPSMAPTSNSISSNVPHMNSDIIFPAHMPQGLTSKEKLNKSINIWNSTLQVQSGKPQPPVNVEGGMSQALPAPMATPGLAPVATMQLPMPANIPNMVRGVIKQEDIQKAREHRSGKWAALSDDEIRQIISRNAAQFQRRKARLRTQQRIELQQGQKEKQQNADVPREATIAQQFNSSMWMGMSNESVQQELAEQLATVRGMKPVVLLKHLQQTQNLAHLSQSQRPIKVVEPPHSANVKSQAQSRLQIGSTLDVQSASGRASYAHQQYGVQDPQDLRQPSASPPQLGLPEPMEVADDIRDKITIKNAVETSNKTDLAGSMDAAEEQAQFVSQAQTQIQPRRLQRKKAILGQHTKRRQQNYNEESTTFVDDGQNTTGLVSRDPFLQPEISDHGSTRVDIEHEYGQKQPTSGQILVSPLETSTMGSPFVLSYFARVIMREQVIEPLMRKSAISFFHPFICSCSDAIDKGWITCFRDLEDAFLDEAPFMQKQSDRFDFFLSWMRKIQSAMNGNVFSERELTRPGYQPYTHQYFDDRIKDEFIKEQKIEDDVVESPHNRHIVILPNYDLSFTLPVGNGWVLNFFYDYFMKERKRFTGWQIQVSVIERAQLACEMLAITNFLVLADAELLFPI